ncbi:tetratricopeptide repeat protein [Stappia sp. ES.058]|uniref:tetratricopeptide repeat protein n=1 Tax=Stappia sp. ES.058 TaxID=1881061 RepID=UPI00087C9CD0|nr:tetratricopeptide repeat protein [Stappia sp. ES.058]SDT93582.1 Tetratricopeptide repeat-containing protein [Stappia sp. ES.058]
MFKDDACLEKFVTMLVATSVAGAATGGVAVVPGAAEALVSGGGLLTRLSGQRRSDAHRIIHETTVIVRAQWTVWIATSSRTDEADLANAVASFEEVVPHIAPRPADVVAKRLKATAIADLMLERAEAARPDLYADKSPRNATAKLAREFLHELVRRSYGLLTANPDYLDRIAPDLWRGVLEQLGDIKADTGAIREKQDAQGDQLGRLEAMLAALPERTAAARASGISDDALIALARTFSEGVADAEQAFRELKYAVEIAIGVQQEGAAGTNLGAFVDEVLRRVALLSATGDYDGAASEIDTALAAEEAEHKERMVRLLDAGIEQDLLRRRPEAVADRIVRKTVLENAAGTPLFEALRPGFESWYESGHSKGVNLDLEVVVALAQRVWEIADGPDQRGTLLNILGTALLTLGERESANDRLEEAISAYRFALEEFTRARFPLQWASVQMNLGNALQALGQRESGIGCLEEAVTAYRLSLEERTRARDPFNWAKVQMNLGNALRIMGERESGTDRLEEAVTAFRLSLEERARARVPQYWAMTQMNLGIALTILGQRKSGTDRLEEAVSAYRLSLEETPQARVPLEWAMIQMNLGNALTILGDRQNRTDYLEEAVTAYRRSLEENTRARVPFLWARVQMNLGNSLLFVGERNGRTDELEEAVEACRLALEEITRARVPVDWAGTQMNLGNALMSLGWKMKDLQKLAEARTALLGANEVFEEAGIDLYRARIAHWLEKTERAIAELENRGS